MGCQSCKKNKSKSPLTIETIQNTTRKVENVIKIFIGIWAVLGLYGLVSLINKLL
jgi:hypothetical protein